MKVKNLYFCQLMALLAIGLIVFYLNIIVLGMMLIFAQLIIVINFPLVTLLKPDIKRYNIYTHEGQKLIAVLSNEKQNIVFYMILDKWWIYITPIFILKKINLNFVIINHSKVEIYGTEIIRNSTTSVSS